MKWLTLENAEASATLKQHVFIHKAYKKPYINEEYDGNISLCGKISCVNEDELRVSFDELEEETMNDKTACKICMKKIKELKD